MRPAPFLTLSLALALSSTCSGQQVKVIAHRGFWKVFGSAQNSIVSLRKADSIAAYGSEFDVYLTADNGLVVYHDRTRDGVSMIFDSTDVITALKLGNGETVPTLDAYLDEAEHFRNNTRLILEIKPLDDENRERQAVALILETLDNHNLRALTDIISFSKAVCFEVIRLAPDIKVQYLNGDLTPKELKRLGFSGADYDSDVYRDNPSWIRKCHKLGLEVNVWTVNDEDEMHYFIKKGVDYITTNEPILLQQIKY